MKNKIPPLFITFEGGEGAGKTTLILKLKEILEKQGHAVVLTREPGGTALGENIREWLLSPKHKFPICDAAELMLFLASRAQHIEEIIRPALDTGKIVLCDRFNDSTIAYQGAGRKLGTARVKLLCDLLCGDIIPHLTFYLDIDPQTGLERTASAAKENAPSGSVDRIEAENLLFHERIRKAFLNLAVQNPSRFHCLDATKTAENVFNDALKILNTRISNVI